MFVCVLYVQCVIFRVLMCNRKNKDMSRYIADKAIKYLWLGVIYEDEYLIREAYRMVDKELFDWDMVPDSLYEEWKDLVDKADDILYEK